MSLSEQSTQSIRRPSWLTSAFVISVVALLSSLFSAINSYRSANFSSRSARAAENSSRAALTNAEWASYQRNPHHDLKAKVLKFAGVMRGMSDKETNGYAYLDLALINDGNQSEIVRRITLYYCDSPDSEGNCYSPKILNLQFPKGEKQVFHLDLDRRLSFTGKDVWLKVGVTAIGPDAEDIESKWLVTKFNIAADGNGAQWVVFWNTNLVRVVSNAKLPTQRPFEEPFF